MFNPHLMNERDLSIRIFKRVGDRSLDSENNFYIFIITALNATLDEWQ